MRILILTKLNLLFVNDILFGLIKERKKEIIGIIESDFLISDKSFIQSILMVLKKSGFRYFFSKALETVLVSFLFYKKYIKKHSIPLYKTNDINSKETLDLIKNLKPDVIVSFNFNQLLKKDALEIPKYGCVNIHPTLLPKYAGVSPFFWVLAKGEKETGVTTHFMNEKFDAGDIIIQEKFKIKEDDTPVNLSTRISHLAGDVLLKSLRMIEDKKVRRIGQDMGKYTYYPFPGKEDVDEFIKLKRKLWRFKDFNYFFNKGGHNE